MNLPNRLTVLRMVMIPIFLYFALTPGIPYKMIIATVIYVAAALTDAVDGYLARKYNLITNFGKFLDPLADKMLVTSALIALVGLQHVSSLPVIIIIMRELAITSLRTIAMSSGRVIAASNDGKIKATAQNLAIIFSLVEIHVTGGAEIGYYLVWVAAVFTLYSGIMYLVRNRDVLSDG